MGFPGWPEFNEQQTAVRTRYIDDWLQSKLTPTKVATQWINVGAGMDTRPQRLQFVESTKCFEVDFPEVHKVKA